VIPATECLKTVNVAPISKVRGFGPVISITECWKVLKKACIGR
jgi:hypothetical protein